MDSSPLSSRFTRSQKRSSRAEDLARELSNEEPGLSLPKELEAYVPDEWTDAPALHLDDQSAISTATTDTDDSYIQDRARLRARDGDYVAASPTHSDAYESYCRENLSLGDVEWLHPRVEGDPRKLANHCIRDRHLRHTLVHAIRRDRLRYVHPYSGSRDVWELAIMLHQRSRRTVEVVAPHPRLCEWVNDKASFAETASRLFGPQTIPETHSVWNLTTLAASVRELASQSAHIVLKLPDAAGGDGNLVLPAETYRNRSDKEIHRLLQDRLLGLAWHGDKRLLVSRWESPVAGAPPTRR